MKNIITQIIEKLCCKHQWEAYASRNVEKQDINQVRGTESWSNPKFVIHTYPQTTEILVCAKCGKIHKITY